MQAFVRNRENGGLYPWFMDPATPPQLPGDRLRAERERAGYSIRDLAEQTGISHNTIVAWERNPSRLKRAKIEHRQAVEQIAGALGVEPMTIWGQDPAPKPITVLPMPMVSIPVVGRAGAGDAEGIVDAIDDDHVEIPQILAGQRARFGVLVEGTSMLPHLEPGDVAVFEPSHVPRIGITNLIRMSDGLRVKVIERDGSRLQLRSFAPDHPAEPLGDSPVTVLGYLVGYYRYSAGRMRLEAADSGLRF